MISLVIITCNCQCLQQGRGNNQLNFYDGHVAAQCTVTEFEFHAEYTKLSTNELPS